MLVSSSAIGYYGDRGDAWLDETTPPASDFLGRWPASGRRPPAPAAQAGIRVVRLRTGVVLTPEGGALGKMLLPFRPGVGGVLGSGRQYMSWIAIDDLLDVIHFAMTTPALDGPVNAVAPAPVTNREFTKTLGRVLGRPDHRAGAGLRAAPRLRRDGGRDAARQHARAAARLLDAGYRFRFAAARARAAPPAREDRHGRAKTPGLEPACRAIVLAHA